MTQDEADRVQQISRDRAERQRLEMRSLLEIGIPITTRSRQHEDDLRVFEGKLGHITFYAQNYYWVALGRVPHATALELYEHPLGKRVIRVAGHCGCPPPSGWVKRIAPDGRQVLDASKKKELERLKGSVGDYESLYIFSTERVEGEQSYIELYHIDGDAGLMLFVNTLRKNGVIP